MLLYYITDRHQFPASSSEQRHCLLDKIAEAARCGVDYIQLREKDLPARELEALAREVVALVKRERTCNTQLLINSRTDIAFAAGADGVHLTATDIAAAEARMLWSRFLTGNGEWETENGIFGVSCHTPAEVRVAAAQGADFAVFAPVFEKAAASLPGVGLDALREACRASSSAPRPMPVLALGGITLDNARLCREAGAAGVAAIRLFQENDIGEVVGRLRALWPAAPEDQKPATTNGRFKA